MYRADLAVFSPAKTASFFRFSDNHLKTGAKVSRPNFDNRKMVVLMFFPVLYPIKPQKLGITEDLVLHDNPIAYDYMCLPLKMEQVI